MAPEQFLMCSIFGIGSMGGCVTTAGPWTTATTGLLRLAKIAFSQARGTLDADISRVWQEIGETYLKSTTAAGFHLSPKSRSKEFSSRVNRLDSTFGGMK